MKRIRNFLLIVVIFIAAFALTGCGSKTIDLNKYITFEYSGYNTVGKVTYTFDEENFEKDYKDKVKIKSKNDANIKWAVAQSNGSDIKALILSCIDAVIDKTENLKNKDKVTLNWICNEDLAKKYFGVKLKYSNIKDTVSGLQEISKFNPFEHIEVSFSGTSPNGHASINKDNTSKEMEYIDFILDKEDGLKEGDKVTIKSSIKSKKDFLEKFGEELSKTKKDYTVSGLTKYITKKDEIPEDKYNEIDNFLQEKLKSDLLRKNNRDFKDIKLLGNYIASLKEGENTSDNNYVYFVYKVTLHNNLENKDFSYYWYGYYKDVLRLSDGTCNIDLNSCTVPNTSIWSNERINYATGSSCYGVEDLDHFYENCKEKISDSYVVESTIAVE